MYKNLILSGGIFHPFDETSTVLAQLLEPCGIVSTITTDIEAGLQQLETAGDYQLLTVNALRWLMAGEKYDPYRDEWQFSLSEQGRQRLANHVSSGGGLLALHTASICFDDWPQWRQILGGVWVWGRSFHPELSQVELEVTACDSPITRGLNDFSLHDEVYHCLEREDDVKPLLTAKVTAADGSQPLLWSRTYGKGRVVYDALGHDSRSILHPSHSRILKRSALWLSAHHDAQVEAV